MGRVNLTDSTVVYAGAAVYSIAVDTGAGGKRETFAYNDVVLTGSGQKTLRPAAARDTPIAGDLVLDGADFRIDLALLAGTPKFVRVTGDFTATGTANAFSVASANNEVLQIRGGNAAFFSNLTAAAGSSFEVFGSGAIDVATGTTAAFRQLRVAREAAHVTQVLGGGLVSSTDLQLGVGTLQGTTSGAGATPTLDIDGTVNTTGTFHAGFMDTNYTVNASVLRTAQTTYHNLNLAGATAKQYTLAGTTPLLVSAQSNSILTVGAESTLSLSTPSPALPHVARGLVIEADAVVDYAAGTTPVELSLGSFGLNIATGGALLPKLDGSTVLSTLIFAGTGAQSVWNDQQQGVASVGNVRVTGSVTATTAVRGDSLEVLGAASMELSGNATFTAATIASAGSVGSTAPGAALQFASMIVDGSFDAVGAAVSLSTGSLTIGASGSYENTATGAGSALSIAGNLTNDGSFVNTSTVLSSAVVTVAGNIAGAAPTNIQNLTITGATATLSNGAVAVDVTLALANGAVLDLLTNTLEIRGATPIATAGNGNFSASHQGTIRLAPGSAITNVTLVGDNGTVPLSYFSIALNASSSTTVFTPLDALLLRGSLTASRGILETPLAITIQGGSLTVAADAAVTANGGTVTIQGTGTLGGAGSTALSTLILGGAASATTSLGGSVTAGSLSVGAGSASSLTAPAPHEMTATASLSLDSGSLLGTGRVVFGGSGVAFTVAGASSVLVAEFEYAGTAPTTVRALAYGGPTGQVSTSVLFSGATTFTAEDGALSLSGNWVVGSAATFDPGAAATNSVTFLGGFSQTITMAKARGSFANLVVEKGAGTATVSESTGVDLDVEGSFALEQGTVDVSDRELEVAGDLFLDAGTVWTSGTTTLVRLDGAAAQDVQDLTATGQQLGNVEVANAAGVDLQSPVFVRDLTILGGATLRTNSQNMSIFGSLDNSGTLQAPAGTFTFRNAAVANETFVRAGASSLPNVTVNLQGNRTLEIRGNLTVTGNLSVDPNSIVRAPAPTTDVEIAIDGSTTLGGQLNILASSTQTVSTEVIHGGSVSISNGSFYSVTGSVSAILITFQTGVTVANNGNLTMVANDSDVEVRFGGTSVVATTLNNATAVFSFVGRDAANRIRLRSIQEDVTWNLTYNRATIETSPSDLHFVNVQDSDASAANLVRATDSFNNGNNFNWNFGGDHVILSQLLDANGQPVFNARVKLFISNAAGTSTQSLTARTSTTTGEFGFEFTLTGNDRFSFFADNASFTASVVGLMPDVAPAPGNVNLDVLQAGFLRLVNFSATGTSATATPELLPEHLAMVDSAASLDADAGFTVSGANLSVAAGLTLQVAPGVIYSSTSTNGAVSVPGAVEVLGQLRVGGTLTSGATTTVDGAGAQLLLAGDANLASDLTVTNNGSVAPQTNVVLSVEGDITLPPSSIVNPGTNDWTLQLSGSKVQTVSSSSDVRLVVVQKSGSNDVVLAAPLQARSLTMASASAVELDLNGQRLTVADDVIVSGGRLVAGTAQEILVGRTWALIVGGLFERGADSTVTFTGPGAQVTGSSKTTFHNLTVSSTSDLSVSFDTEVANELRVEGNGELNLGGVEFTLSGISDGNVDRPAFFADPQNVEYGTASVRYTGSDPGDVIFVNSGNASGTIDYFNLAVAGSTTTRFMFTTNDVLVQNNLSVPGGVLELRTANGADLLVVGSVTIGASGTIDAGDQTAISIDRNWTAAGASSYVGVGAALVRFGGTLPATVTSNGQAFRNLTVEKFGANGRLVTQDTIAVTERLAIDQGRLRLLGQSFALGGGIGAGTLSVDVGGRIEQHLLANGTTTTDAGTFLWSPGVNTASATIAGLATFNQLTVSGTAATTFQLGGAGAVSIRRQLSLLNSATLAHGNGSVSLDRGDAAITEPLVIEAGSSYTATQTASLFFRSNAVETGPTAVLVPVDGAVYNDLAFESAVASTSFQLDGAGTELLVGRDLSLTLAGPFAQSGKTIRFQGSADARLRTNGTQLGAILVSKGDSTRKVTLLDSLTQAPTAGLEVAIGSLALEAHDLTVQGGNVVVAGTIQQTAGTVSLNGGTHSGGGSLQAFNLTLSGASLGIATVVNDTFTNAASTTASTLTATLTGTSAAAENENLGTLDASAAITLAGLFRNQTGAAFSSSADFEVGNGAGIQLNVANTSTFDFTGPTLLVRGNLTNAGSMDVGATNVLRVEGTLNHNGEAFDLSGTSALEVTGALLQGAGVLAGLTDASAPVSSITVGELVQESNNHGVALGGSGSAITLTSTTTGVSVSANGDVALTGTTIAIAGAVANSAGGELALAASTVTVGGAATLSGTASTSIGGGGATVVISGAVSVSGAGDLDFGDTTSTTLSAGLTQSAGGAVRFGAGSGALTIGGNLTQSGSGIFIAPVTQTSVAGTVTLLAGQFDASAATVFTGPAGGGAQAVSLGGNPLVTFQVQDPDGTTFAGGLEFSGDATLTGPATVNGSVTGSAATPSITGDGRLTIVGGSLLRDGTNPLVAGTVGVDVTFSGLNDTVIAPSRAYGKGVVFESNGTGAFTVSGSTTLSAVGSLEVLGTGSQGPIVTLQDATTVTVGGSLAVRAGSLLVANAAATVTGDLVVADATLDAVAGPNNWTVVGNVSSTGTAVVDVENVGLLNVGRDLLLGGATFVPPAEVRLNGAAAQTVNVTGGGPFRDLRVAQAAGTTAVLASDVTVTGTFAVDSPVQVQAARTVNANGDLVVGVGGSYVNLATSTQIVFGGPGDRIWRDQTGVQNFGNVRIAKNSSVTLESSVTVGDFEVESGTFNAGANQITVRGGSWLVSSPTGTFEADQSTVRFEGDVEPVVIRTGNDAFNSLVIAKSAVGDVVSSTAESLTILGNLDVTVGHLVIDNIAFNVTGNTNVARLSRLEILDGGDASRTHEFTGALTLTGGLAGAGSGGFFAYDNTVASTTATSTLRFMGGVTVGQRADFRITHSPTSATGTVDVVFAAGSFSRVGGTDPIAGRTDDETVFQILGAEGTSGERSVRLNTQTPTSTAQWFIAYNVSTTAQSVTEGPLHRIEVANSDATAGNLVRATSSINGGNTENWSFGGANFLQGLVFKANGDPEDTGRLVKLIRVRGAEVLTLTTVAEQQGSLTLFSFDTDFQDDDRVAIYTDNDAAFVAGFSTVVASTTTFATTTLVLRQNELRVYAANADGTVSSTALGEIDSSLDADVPYTVDGISGALAVRGGVRLIVLSDAFATTTLQMDGDLSVPGPLTVTASSTLELFAQANGDNQVGAATVFGTILGADEAALRVNGALLVHPGALLQASENARLVVFGLTTASGSAQILGGGDSAFEFESGLVVNDAAGEVRFGTGLSSVKSGISDLRGLVSVQPGGTLSVVGNSAIANFTGTLAIGNGAAASFASALGNGSGTTTVGEGASLSLSGSNSTLNVHTLALGDGSSLTVAGVGSDLVTSASFSAGTDVTVTVADDVTFVGAATVGTDSSITAGTQPGAGGSVTFPAGATVANPSSLVMTGGVNRALTTSGTVLSNVQLLGGGTVTLNGTVTTADGTSFLADATNVTSVNSLTTGAGANLEVRVGPPGAVTATVAGASVGGDLTLTGDVTFNPGTLSVAGSLTKSGAGGSIGVSPGSLAAIDVTGPASISGGQVQATTASFGGGLAASTLSAFQATSVTVTGTSSFLDVLDLDAATLTSAGTASFLGATVANVGTLGVTADNLVVAGTAIVQVGLSEVAGEVQLQSGALLPTSLTAATFTQTGGAFSTSSLPATSVSITGLISVAAGTFDAVAVTSTAGSVAVSGGAVSVDSLTATAAGPNGVLTVSGAGSLTADTLDLRAYRQTGGQADVEDLLATAETFEVSGGALIAATTTTVGTSGLISGGTITLDAGSLFAVTGDLVQTGGTYNNTVEDVNTTVSGTLTFGGVAGTTFNAGALTTIGGSLATAVASQGTLNGDFAGSLFTVGADVLLNGAIFEAPETLRLNGEWLRAAGATFEHNEGTVEFVAATPLEVDISGGRTIFHTVVVSSTKTVNLAANMTVVDHIDAVGTATFRLGGGEVVLQGLDPLRGAGTYEAQGSTVVYTALATTTAGPVTVRPIDYHNLTINASTTAVAQSFSAALTGTPVFSYTGNLLVQRGELVMTGPSLVLISGRVQIVEGVLDLQSTNLNVDGSWEVLNSDSLTFSTTPLPTVNFTGTVARQIRTTTSTAGDAFARFPNLQIEKGGLGTVEVTTTTPGTVIAGIDVDGDLRVVSGLFALNGRDALIRGGDLQVDAAGRLTQGDLTGTDPAAGAVSMLATGAITGNAGLDGLRVFALAIDDGTTNVTTTVSGAMAVYQTITLADTGVDQMVLLGTVELRAVARPAAGFFDGFDVERDLLAHPGSTVIYRRANVPVAIDGDPLRYHNLRLDAGGAGAYVMSEPLFLSGDLTTLGAFGSGGQTITFSDNFVTGAPVATASAINIATTQIAALEVDKTAPSGLTLASNVTVTGTGDVLLVESGTLDLAAQVLQVNGADARVANGARVISSGASTFDLVGGTLNVEGAGVDTGEATLATLLTNGAASQIVGGRVTAATSTFGAITTVTANPFTVSGVLTVNTASTLGSGSRTILTGSGTPLAVNGTLSVAADAEVDFRGTSTVAVPGGADNVPAYGVLRFSAVGPYLLNSDATTTRLFVDAGTFRVENRTLEVSGTTVGVTGDLTLETTVGGPTSTLRFTNAAPTVTVTGTLRLLGAETTPFSPLAPAAPDFPAVVDAAGANLAIAVLNAGRLEAALYRIAALGNPNGVLQIAPQAQLLGGNDALRQGRIDIAQDLAIDIAIANQALQFQEVQLFGPSGTRNVRHRTLLGGGGVQPGNTIRFTNSVLADPRDPGTQLFPGTLWGDEFDNDLGDVDGATSTSTLSRGTVRWEDSKAPEILTIETFDLISATVTATTGVNLAQADGSLDHIRITFDEPVDVESVNPAGFSINGIAATTRVTTGDATTTIIVAWSVGQQVAGTQERTIDYDDTIGGVRDSGGLNVEDVSALPFVSGGTGVAGGVPLSIDRAGPVIVQGLYDNRDTAAPEDDRIHLTFSEQVDSVATTVAGVYLLGTSNVTFGAGAAATPGTDTDVTIIVGEFTEVANLATTIALVAGAFVDNVTTSTVNATPGANEPKPLGSFVDGDGRVQAFQFRVTASGDEFVAGEAVQYSVEALDRFTQPIPSYRVRGGFRFEIFDSTGSSTAGLEVRDVNIPEFGFGRFSNFRPFTTQGGVTIQFSDRGDAIPNDTASGTPQFFANPFFLPGGLSPTTTAFTFPGSTFVVNLENTKATLNATATSARELTLRVTELGTDTTGITDGSNLVAWRHGPAERVLTLLGSDELDGNDDPLEPDAERLIEGVRSQDIRVGVQSFKRTGLENPPVGATPLERFEREAGQPYTVRVVHTDRFFNVVRDLPATQVQVSPSLASQDPFRALQLEKDRFELLGLGTIAPTNPLDGVTDLVADLLQVATTTVEGLGVTGGGAEVLAKTFRAALDQRLTASTTAATVPASGRIPSSLFHVFPGPTAEIAVLLPGQTLREGVPDRVLNAVASSTSTDLLDALDITFGAPFSGGQAGQGTSFQVMAVAVDRHGNWNFQHEAATSTLDVVPDAIVAKVLDPISGGTASDPSDFDDTLLPAAQRFGLTMSGIAAAEQIPAGSANLALDLNRILPAPPGTVVGALSLSVDLDNRLTGTEITESLRNQIRAFGAPALRNADVVFFPEFRRYLIRSGALADVGANDTSGVFVTPVDLDPAAEVNRLLLGEDFPDTVQPFSPARQGRGSIGQILVPFQVTASPDADLADAIDSLGGELVAENPVTLRFTNGIGFFAATSQSPTATSTAERLVQMRVARPAADPIDAGDPTAVDFFSDPFPVGDALLAIDPVRGIEMRDVGVADGVIDQIEVFFDPSSDTVVEAQQINPALFTLFMNVGGSTVQRSGSLAQVGTQNSVVVTFEPGLPTTDGALVTLNIRADNTGVAIRGEQSNFVGGDGFRAPVASLSETIDVPNRVVLIDKAAPAIVTSTFLDTDANGRPDFLELVFSEPVSFAAGTAISVSGLEPALAANLGDTLQLAINSVSTTVTLTAGVTGAGNVAAALNAQLLPFGATATFDADRGRYVLRTISTGATSTLAVTGGTLATSLRLGATGGGTERAGTDAGLLGDIEDFLVLSADGVDLRDTGAGSVFADGRRVIVRLRNVDGSMSDPLFAVIDNFNRSFFADVNGNTAGGFLSNVGGLAAQNTIAGGSGFLRIRDTDANQADGVLTGLLPGAVLVDPDLSLVPRTAIEAISFQGFVSPDFLVPAVSGIEPVYTVPSTPGLFAQLLPLGTDPTQAQVEFIALTPGSYTFEYAIQVTSTSLDSLPLALAIGPNRTLRRTFTAQIVDLAPRAEVPDGPVVVETALGAAIVPLDASRSTDPNGLHTIGGGLGFQWSVVEQPAGSVATITADSDAVTTADVDLPGTYVFEVVVSDQGGQSTARVTAIVQSATDHLPTADAGLRQVVRTGQTVTLDGRRSADQDGDALSLAWTQVAGATVALSDASAAQPTFTAPAQPGVLRFELTVSDDAFLTTSVPAQVEVLVVDDGQAPRVPPFVTFEALGGTPVAGERFVLVASDSQGAPRVADYEWRQVGGASLQLAPSGDSLLTVAPLPGTYTFQLTGIDRTGVRGIPARQEIVVLPDAADNLPTVQIVNSLATSTIVLAGGNPVLLSLDASGSTADNAPAFFWRQLEGPLSGLSDPTVSNPTVTLRTVGRYRFEVTVSDTVTGARARGTTEFVVDLPVDLITPANNDRAPTAVFLQPLDVLVGQAFALNASGSLDPDGQGVEVFFEQIAGLPTVLGGKPNAVQTGTPLAEGTYRYRVTILGAQDGRASLTVERSFNVAENPASGGGIATSSSGGSGGGCHFDGEQSSQGASLPIALLLAVLVVRFGRRLGALLATALRPVAALVALVAGTSVLSGCGAGVIAAVAIALSGGGGGGAVDLTQPDLVLGTVEGPVAATVETDDTDPLAPFQFVRFQGVSGDLAANLINIGNDLAPVGTEVAWYLSKTKVIDQSAFRVRTVQLEAALELGAALRLVGPEPVEPEPIEAVADVEVGALPPPLEPGAYFLLARANDNNAIAELDTTNNTRRGDIVVQVYAGPPADAGQLDFVITRVAAPTSAVAGGLVSGAVVVTNLGAEVTSSTTGTLSVRLATNGNVGAPVLTSPVTFPPSLIGGTFTIPFSFTAASTGRFVVEAQVDLAGDTNNNNNNRFATLPTVVQANAVTFQNGAVLPFTQAGDPVVLQIATQRPAVNTFLPVGGQRVLAFEIPDTNLAQARAQALITVQSNEFDPIVELLSPSGSVLASIDDFQGERRGVLYVSLATSAENRSFFLVVTGAEANQSGNFVVNIDVNPIELGDDGPVGAQVVGDLLNLAALDEAVDPLSVLTRTFVITGAETEFFFSVPALINAPLTIGFVTDPALEIPPFAIDDAQSSLVRYDATGIPTDIPFVIELRRGAAGTVTGYQLQAVDGDGRLALPPGDYVLLLRAAQLPIPLDLDLTFELGDGILFGLGADVR